MMIPDDQGKTIKTSSRYWIQEIGGSLLVLIIFIFAIIYWGGRFYLIGGIAIIIAIINLLREVGPAYSSRISTTHSKLNGCIGKFEFSESWEAIKVVQFSGHGANLDCVIWTEENLLHIPCKYFGEKELEKLLKEHLPPEVFHPLAHQKLPVFQEWEKQRIQQFNSLYEPLKISLGKSERLVGSISIILGLLLGSLVFFNADIVPILCLVAFFVGLGGVFILFSMGKVEATHQTIKLRTLFREYELVWNTLREVYTNPNKQGGLALVGDECRIILPPPVNWSGEDRELLYELINFKIETLGIKPVASMKVTYWYSKKF